MPGGWAPPLPTRSTCSSGTSTRSRKVRSTLTSQNWEPDFQGYLQSALEALEGDWGPLPIPRSIYAGLLKAFVFGFTIATVGCATGLRASQGASGVGIATRTAVRASIVLIIVINDVHEQYHLAEY